MLKILKIIQSKEAKLKNKIGYKYTYILLAIGILSCYYLGYIIGKFIF